LERLIAHASVTEAAAVTSFLAAARWVAGIEVIGFVPREVAGLVPGLDVFPPPFDPDLPLSPM
jgi:hypothetical protein